MLGELLANDTSRRIIAVISDQELYQAEITSTLNTKTTLAIHHMKKLVKLEMVTITNKKIHKRTKNHKFYKMKPEFHIIELRKIVC